MAELVAEREVVFSPEGWRLIDGGNREAVPPDTVFSCDAAPCKGPGEDGVEEVAACVGDVSGWFCMHQFCERNAG